MIYDWAKDPDDDTAIEYQMALAEWKFKRCAFAVYLVVLSIALLIGWL